MAINEPSQLSQPINLPIEDVFPIEIVPYCRTSISWLRGCKSFPTFIQWPSFQQQTGRQLSVTPGDPRYAEGCFLVGEGRNDLSRFRIPIPRDTTRRRNSRGCFGEKIWRSRIGIVPIVREYVARFFGWIWKMVNVGKYTSYMDGRGTICFASLEMWTSTAICKTTHPMLHATVGVNTLPSTQFESWFFNANVKQRQ